MSSGYANQPVTDKPDAILMKAPSGTAKKLSDAQGKIQRPSADDLKSDRMGGVVTFQETQSVTCNFLSANFGSAK